MNDRPQKAMVCPTPAGVVFRPDKLYAHAGLVSSGARRRKWRPDERIDGIIRAAYLQLVQESDRQALKRAACEIGWPKFAVTQRAAVLGLVRVKEPNWSLREVAILGENCQYGVAALQRKLAAAGFNRTFAGIELKRKRLDLVRAYAGYSATALSKLVGMDGHTVRRWIVSGMLPAEKRGTERTARQGGDSYVIQHADVRAFLFAHPEEFDLRKVDSWWFLDLVTDGEITR